MLSYQKWKNNWSRGWRLWRRWGGPTRYAGKSYHVTSPICPSYSSALLLTFFRCRIYLESLYFCLYASLLQSVLITLVWVDFRYSKNDILLFHVLYCCMYNHISYIYIWYSAYIIWIWYFSCTTNNSRKILTKYIYISKYKLIFYNLIYLH